MTEPVEVTSHTGWITATSTTVMAILGSGGLFAFLIAWVKTRNPRRQMEIGAEERMREELLKQNEALNSRINDLERQLERERAVSRNESELANHRINGLEQLLLMTFETIRIASPDRVPEIVERMSEAWEKHKQRVAVEKGEIMASREATND